MTHPAETPPAFRPVIRLVSVVGGVDPNDYAARLVRALVPHLDDTAVAERVTDIRKAPVPVADPDTVLAPVAPAVAARLRALGQQVDATARDAFGAVPDPLVTTTVTVAEADGAGFAASTVVWVREGSEATTQFVFPRLVADLSRGRFDELTPTPIADTALAARPASVARVPDVQADLRDSLDADEAMDDVGSTIKQGAESVAEVASSVSWALPPPWNIGVTAGLSVLQLILHATDKPDGPSPFETLKDAIINYLQQQRLDDQLDDVRHFSDQLLLKTSSFTYTPEQMAALGSGAEKDFEDWYTGAYGIDRLGSVVNSIISDLERATSLDDAKSVLAAATSATTMWAVAQKAWMQYRACKLKAQLDAGDVADYANGSSSWQTIFREIQATLFDLEDPDHPNNPLVKGYASRIETSIDALRAARLAKIHATERTSRQVWVGGTTSGGFAYGQNEDQWGWRFVDDADGNEWAHFRPDTTEQEDACHSHTVEHQSEVEQDRNARVTSVTSTLDAQTSDATTALKTLKDKVTEIASLQPPPPPKDTPTVTLATAGTATPSGVWTKGATVTYQIAFANDDKIGDPGTPSAPLTVGDFAGAVLSNVPQDSKSTFIHVVRTIKPSPEATAIVRKLRPVAMGTTSINDTA